MTLQGSMILLHGDPKIGKTQLADTFPGRVQFIATEPGHRYIKESNRKIVKNLPPDGGWDEFKRFVTNKAGLLKRCQAKKNGVKTVVVDTIAGLYDLCMNRVCKKNGWDHPSDGAHGKGWNAVAREFYDGMNRLAWTCTEGGATLIIIDHTKVEEIETRTSTRQKKVCAMTGQARKIVVPVPDHIWYLGWDPKGTSGRCLHLEGSQDIEAGTRDKSITATRVCPLSEASGYKHIVQTLTKKTKKRSDREA